MATNIYAKTGGVQRSVTGMYLKDNNTWKPISKVYVKDAGAWRQVFGITSLFAAFSSVGTTNFTVPAGVYSLFVSYPTTTGVVTTSVAVTPAQVIPIVIGDYGATSSFNGQTLPAYSKVVLNHFSGNVDAQVTQTFSVATDTSITYTTNGTQNAASYSNFNSVGIYFNTDSESAQGDFGEYVTIDTVPKSTLLGNFQISMAVQGSGGYLSYITQPTVANNYFSQYQVGEGNRSNNPVTFQATLTQQGYVSISYTNVSYTTVGNSDVFTVPTGVYQLAVTVAGGGGSGGAGYQAGGAIAGGNNGTGGKVVTGILQVQPGQTFTIQPGGGAGVARGNWVGGTGGAGGSHFSATYVGIAGTTGAGYHGGGGGRGASSVILSSTGSAIIVAGGGAGGNGGADNNPGGGGAGASAGSSTIPAGFTSSTGTNGGLGAAPVASYSGGYSNGTGPSQISVIQSDIVNTYPFLYTPGGSISGVVGGGNDWNFPMTLGNGVNLLARGSVLNYDNASGAFAVGRTVSGINFTYGVTQANGGQSFNFYTGMIPTAGSSGYVSITY
jgi:hypothetical protein